ncbi:MAG: prolyl oligopeptidase family serine peptidase [Armatimonadia bacterium]|nr:prolyl oligopeptidase family serine peptidase [Armatimonadia bacterium]
MLTWLCITAAMVGAPGSGPGEPEVRIEPYLNELRDDLPHGMRFRPGEMDFETWSRRLREHLADLLALPDVDTRLLDSWEGEWERVDVRGTDHLRQRVLLKTEENLWVPAYLCLPPDTDGPLPVVICCQGHSRDGMRLTLGLVDDDTWQAMVVEGDRDNALQAVRNGYAALALELRSFGELRNEADIESNATSSCDRHSLLAIQASRVLMGMRVHDVMAAIDYLSERPEIDPARIAMTGNSGGGSITLYASAMDERILASIPSCAFCTYRDSIQAMRHCSCNFVPGMAESIEMGDLAGLVAPRWQLIIAGEGDPIFPIQGVRQAYAHLETIYAAAGVPERVELYVGEGGHRYYAEPVREFLDRAFASATPGTELR